MLHNANKHSVHSNSGNTSPKMPVQSKKEAPLLFDTEKAIQRINALLHVEGDKNITQYKQMLAYFREQILSDPASVNLPDLEKMLDTLETPRKLMGRINALFASGKLSQSDAGWEQAKSALQMSPSSGVCAIIARQLDSMEENVRERQ